MFNQAWSIFHYSKDELGNNRSTEEHTTREGCDQQPYCFTGMCHAIFKGTE
jgi:hypothetical protein